MFPGKYLHKYISEVPVTILSMVLFSFFAVNYASGQTQQGIEKTGPSVIESMSVGQPQDVIVVLDDTDIRKEAKTLRQNLGVHGDHDTAEVLEMKRARYASMKEMVKGALQPGEHEILKEYSHLPMMFMRVNSMNGMKQLLERTEVVKVYENGKKYPVLTSSLPFINQPQAAAMGMTGAGTAVAVLDTGVNYLNSAFGACTGSGTPADCCPGGNCNIAPPTAPAGCKVACVHDFTPTSDGALDDNGHGTNVSGIVVGVAPDTKVVGLDVFRGGFAYDSDIINAINWSIAWKAAYNIVAVNMSLGDGVDYTSPCENSFSPAVKAARDAGILTVVAAGNDGFTNGISSPACVSFPSPLSAQPAAVSVGAVYDGNIGGVGYSICTDATTAPDKVTCFSNSADFLTILAPGANITAAGITMFGTSQATPHISGSIAVLKGQSAFPSETPDETIARMTGTGVPDLDARNGITKSRIDLLAAVSSDVSFSISGTVKSNTGIPLPGVTVDLSGVGSVITNSLGDYHFTGLTDGATYTVTPSKPGYTFLPSNNTLTINGTYSTIQDFVGTDPLPPVGAIAINGGAAYTRTTSASLTLTAVDAGGGPVTMCISNTSTCTTFSSFASARSWALTAGNGPKTVNVWYRDQWGNTASYSAGIILDTTSPINGTMTASPGPGQIVLKWSGFSDAISGIQGYKVVYAVGAAPVSCASGTPAPGYDGTSTTFTHTGLINQTYGYRVCAIDNAGNVSSGVTRTVRPLPSETDPPTGTIQINKGAAWTKSTAVTLALTGTDASLPVQMCISNTTACTTWTAFAAAKAWTLATGSGTKTVYMWLRDTWRNTTPAGTPITAAIGLDRSAPANGTLTVTPGLGQVILNWKGFTDAISGIAGYKVVYAAGTAPTSCVSGTAAPGYDQTSMTFMQTGLTSGTTYGYRVCAIDNAGNMSTGVAKTVKVQ